MTALWRPPSMRDAESETGRSGVSWTELFYDLVFVVAVANLGRRFADAPSFERGAEFVALFGMLWWAWASVTFLVDRYESNDALARLLAVAQMLGVAGFAAAVAREWSLDAIAVPLAASYAVTRLVQIGMYGRVWWHVEESRPLVGGYLRGFGVDTVLWVASIFIPSPLRYAVWAAAMVISLATPWLMRRIQARSPLSTSHLPERFGLFTILVLGEPVAAVVTGLGAQEADAAPLVSAGAGFVVATALWWIYFDNFEGSVVRRDPNRRHDWRPTTWIYSHFPLALGVATVGAGITHLVASGDAHGQRALAISSGLGLAGALLAMMLMLLSTAGGDPRSRRRRASARFVGAAVIIVLVIAIAVAGARLSPAPYLAALASVLVLQVVFDVIDGAVGKRTTAGRAV